MHASLTPRLKEYVEQKVASGLDNNTSELICETLRAMIQKEHVHEELRASVTQGFEQIQNGDFVKTTSKEEFIEVARGRRNELTAKSDISQNNWSRIALAC